MHSYRVLNCWTYHRTDPRDTAGSGRNVTIDADDLDPTG